MARFTGDRPLVLASTSPSRRLLLERLGLPFTVVAPAVDESPLPGESPYDLVIRLSVAKARSGAEHYSTAWVIGSDQVAYSDDGIIMGKPGARAEAIAQLESASGRSLLFYTGLCLLDASSGSLEVTCINCRIHFRTLTRSQIEGYVDREPAFNCSGSFKSEGLGIALMQRFESDDHTTILGLPLITLVAMLERAGISPLTL